MTIMEFNFNKQKKEHLIITLADKDNTRLLVTTPKKKLMEKMMAFGTARESDIDGESIDALYDIVTEILNTNIEGKVVSKKTVEETIDYADVSAFFNIYMKYINNLSSEKN